MKPTTHLLLKSLSRKQPGLVHAFSPRSLKLKDGTMGELNFTTQNPSASSNVQWFLRSIGINKQEVYLVRQVHGDTVYDLKNASISPDQMAGVSADAIITRQVGTPIGVLTADCIPVVDMQAGVMNHNGDAIRR
jgi:copper oxidase (laccase) domain-containing protein